MANPTPTQERTELIARKQADAARLLSAANDESLKEMVRLSIRDLDEATLWLRQPNVDARPVILAIVDLATNLATGRLDAVDNALRTYGPNAIVIG